MRAFVVSVLLFTSPVLAAEPRVVRDVAYAEPKTERRTLDLYAPAAGSDHPIVVWIHGGGWRQGERREGPFWRRRQPTRSVADHICRKSEVDSGVPDLARCRSARLQGPVGALCQGAADRRRLGNRRPRRGKDARHDQLRT